MPRLLNCISDKFWVMLILLVSEDTLRTTEVMDANNNFKKSQVNKKVQVWKGSCSSENVHYLEGIIELHYYHHATPREINDSKQVPLMVTNTKKRTEPLQQAVAVVTTLTR